MTWILASTAETVGTVSIVSVLVAAFGYSLTLLNRGTDRMDKNAEDRVEAAEHNASDRIAAAERNADDRIASAERNADERVATAERNATAQTRGMVKDLERAIRDRDAALVAVDNWRNLYWDLRSKQDEAP